MASRTMLEKADCEYAQGMEVMQGRRSTFSALEALRAMADVRRSEAFHRFEGGETSLRDRVVAFHDLVLDLDAAAMAEIPDWHRLSYRRRVTMILYALVAGSRLESARDREIERLVRSVTDAECGPAVSAA